MSLPSFADHAVTVIRPARVQDHGSWYDDWDNPEPPRLIEGCVVFPGTSVEDNDRQNAEQVTYTVLAPMDADIRTTDKVQVDLEPDLDLAVFGRPRRIASPTGDLDHLQIELSDWRAS